ncbi:MAG: putative Ig domain-containing protein [Verrucomicrobiota bacterium]
MKFSPLKAALLCSFCSFLTTVMSAGADPIPGGMVVDNFDDNSLNSALWLKEDYTDMGSLAETAKRLNYTATVVKYFDEGQLYLEGQGESYLELQSNHPHYAEDWEAVVDVGNLTSGVSSLDWEAGVALEVYGGEGNRIFVEMNTLNELVELNDELMAYQVSRKFIGGLMTDGADNPNLDAKLTAIGTHKTGVLRISFSAVTKIVTLQVDRSGPANGLQWETLATYGIAGTGGSRTTDWDMQDTDTFSIRLTGLSWSLEVSSGQVYLDNFKLTRSGVTPVAITQQPASRMIVSGQTTPLTVGTTGMPISYQWYAGSTGDTSQPITGATAATYPTPALTAEASYWVRVRNGLGSMDSATAVISVSTTPLAPGFANQPASQIGLVGQPLAFNLVVTGSDPLTYQWRKDAANIANAKTSSLVLAALKTADAAAYSLRATNSVNVQDSTPAYVGVATRGPAIQSVNVSTPLTMNAAVTLPKGISPKYRWQRNGEGLNNGGRVSGVTEKTLKITGMTPEDAGTYTCQIEMTTPAGPVFGNNGETVVKVVEKPVFAAGVLVPLFGDVRVGQMVDFLISANKFPTKYIVSGLPPGLKLDAASGRIHGVPTAAKLVKGAVEPYALKVSASNSAGTSVVENVSWTVQPLYPAAIGTYDGLVARGELNQELGGSFRITVAGTSALSGTLKVGTLSYPMKGSLTSEGVNGPPSARLTISRAAPLAALSLAFSIDLATEKLTGTLKDEGNAATSALEAWLCPWKSTNKADVFLGTYNTVLDPNGGEGPEGFGYMPVKVSAQGLVSWTGKLADGTDITGSVGLGRGGQIPLRHLLYAATGNIQGWMTIDQETKNMDGVVDWFKAEQPVKSKTRSYKDGFHKADVTVIGALYTKPASLILGMQASSLNAALELAESHGNLGSFTSQLFTINSRHVAVADPEGFGAKLSINAVTGVFSGSFSMVEDDPTSNAEIPAQITRSVSINGVLVTRPDFNKGAGYLIVADLPYEDPHPTDPELMIRVTNTPQWSGSAILEAVEPAE